MTSLPFGSKHNLTVIGGGVAPTGKQSLTVRSSRYAGSLAMLVGLFVLLIGCKARVAVDVPSEGIPEIAAETKGIETRLETIESSAQKITGKPNQPHKEVIIEQVAGGKQNVAELNIALDVTKKELAMTNGELDATRLELSRRDEKIAVLNEKVDRYESMWVGPRTWKWVRIISAFAVLGWIALQIVPILLTIFFPASGVVAFLTKFLNNGLPGMWIASAGVNRVLRLRDGK